MKSTSAKRVYREHPGEAVRTGHGPASGAEPEDWADRGFYRMARIVARGASDFIALVLAGFLAYELWARPAQHQPLSLYLELLPLVSLFIIGYAQAGLYPGFGLGPVETLKRLCYVTSFGFLVLAAFSFALKLPHLYSRFTFILAWAFSLLFVPLGRVAIDHFASRWRWWNEPIVVIGTEGGVQRAIRSLRQAMHLGYRPAAVLSSVPFLDRSDVDGVPIVGGLDLAPRLSARGIRIALFEMDEARGLATLDQLQQQFRHVVILPRHDDLRVEVLQVRNLGSLVGIEYTNNLLVDGNRFVKRTLDLVVGGLALVAAAPVILCAGLLVKLSDGGPVFFFQERAGLNGQRLRVPKVRTMRMDAERGLAEYLDANPNVRAEWESRHKLRDDPRLVPFVGRFFRRFSIDELPQLWTVITGKMSLVGPRPFPDYHLRMFSPAFLDLRHRVRPGITGLWQVTVRSDGGIEEQEGYDSYYIRNWSVWMDVYVLSRTLLSVVSGRGAY